MSLEQNKALAHRFHMDIFQQGKLDVSDEILSPDFVWHTPPGNPTIHGPEQVKQAVDRACAELALDGI